MALLNFAVLLLALSLALPSARVRGFPVSAKQRIEPSQSDLNTAPCCLRRSSSSSFTPASTSLQRRQTSMVEAWRAWPNWPSASTQASPRTRQAVRP